MDANKEMMCFSERIGVNKGRTIVETDVIVPDTKPDVSKVLQVDASPILNGSEIQNDRILVYGIVNFNIIYVSEENEVKAVTAKSTFNDIIDLPGAASNMMGNVWCDVDLVEYRVLNGRKFTVKCVLKTEAEVFNKVEQEIITDIEEAEVEKQYQNIQYVINNGTYCKNITVSEKVEIAREMPPIQEILKMEGKISNKSTKVINNKVIVKADMDVVILYIDRVEFKPCSVSLSVPFTEILDIDGITEDWFLAHTMEVRGFTYSVENEEDADARLIDMEATIESRATVMENQSINALKDCYGIRQKINITKSTADLRSNAGEIYVQTGVKSRVELEDAPAVAQIYNLAAKAYIDSLEMEEGRMTVKGRADAYITYISKDESLPIYSLHKEIPFEETVACAEGEGKEAEMVAAVTGMSYTLNGDNSIDVRGNIELKGIVTKKEAQGIISELEMTEQENEQKPASLTVCFVQESDSLWDIAKRYCTSVSSIMEVNRLTDTAKITGRQLIVPKYR